MASQFAPAHANVLRIVLGLLMLRWGWVLVLVPALTEVLIHQRADERLGCHSDWHRHRADVHGEASGFGHVPAFVLRHLVIPPFWVDASIGATVAAPHDSIRPEIPTISTGGVQLQRQVGPASLTSGDNPERWSTPELIRLLPARALRRLTADDRRGSWMSSSFSGASTIKRAKSTRRVRLLARTGSPTCRLQTGRPWLSPSSRSLPRTTVQRASLPNTRRHASTWSSRSGSE
jgi:hypothetical protein